MFYLLYLAILYLLNNSQNLIPEIAWNIDCNTEQLNIKSPIPWGKKRKLNKFSSRCNHLDQLSSKDVKFKYEMQPWYVKASWAESTRPSPPMVCYSGLRVCMLICVCVHMCIFVYVLSPFSSSLHYLYSSLKLNCCLQEKENSLPEKCVLN